MTQIGRGYTGHTATVTSALGHSIALSWAALSDVGRRREVNEDSFIAEPPVFAVADGMGGHSAGDVASAAVVTRLAEHSGTGALAATDIDDALRQAVEDMRRSTGMADGGTGTTVTGFAVTVVGEQTAWLVFNIGDSRVYLFENGVLEQLTRDHSVVQELIDAGRITQQEADFHPHGNVITRAVGFHEDPVPDYRLLAVRPGMRLLVCSDGLTKELTDHGIRHFLLSNPQPMDAASALVDAALGNGGRDNVTVIVVDVLAVSADVGDGYAGNKTGETL